MRQRNTKVREQHAGRKLSRENQRLSTLAMELGFAMSQVLIRDYEFTPEQCNAVLKAVTEQAKLNREVPPREQAPL